jgi:hypothetical protein
MKRNLWTRVPKKLDETRLAASNFNVTEKHIRFLNYAAQAAAIFEIKQNPGIEYDKDYLASNFLNRELLRGYMGDDWATAHLTEWGQGRNKPIEAFGTDRNFAEARYSKRSRDLAEIFYNFQKVEGIKEKAKLLATEDIESVLAELDGAKMLFETGRKIKFVIPSNQKGKDYDLETYLSDGTPVACEMKCKFETTDFSDKTIAKAIAKANDQLPKPPKDKLGAAFVKIPGEWTIHPNFQWIMSDALEKAFRNIQTTSVVYFYWETWNAISLEDVANESTFGFCLNPNARFKHNELPHLVRPSSGHYKRFHEII